MLSKLRDRWRARYGKLDVRFGRFFNGSDCDGFLVIFNKTIYRDPISNPALILRPYDKFEPDEKCSELLKALVPRLLDEEDRITAVWVHPRSLRVYLRGQERDADARSLEDLIASVTENFYDTVVIYQLPRRTPS
jgi:hypothetical protein